MQIFLYEKNPAKAERLASALREAGYVTACSNSFDSLPGPTDGPPSNTILVGSFSLEEFRPMPSAESELPPCPLAAGACAASTFSLLSRDGHRPQLAPKVWEAALNLCKPARPQEELVEHAGEALCRHFLKIPLGLSRLPSCWLAAIPSLLDKFVGKREFGRITPPIAGLTAQHGILVVEFDDEHLLPATRPGKGCLRTELRLWLNLGLYPSAWSPLRPRHRNALRLARPDLIPYLELYPSTASAGFQEEL